ncbi:hypothetical protein F4813DRAFT_187620 [Daldinia decipiens]|uniref:uncharacterized protein n=1 Tax=Daldinia decipiens TaxID=326647 RepID=UPI0020C20EE2|nr:uncharacterized protein F4813DRAFT_187620 [Daldinia decipiens]KAI1655044.1 hypothetical protein F4813DRAFT_187620 [Daldinia decipiens]
MASSLECEVKQTVDPEGMPPLSPTLSSLSEDAETVTGARREVNEDALSILSKESCPDHAGRKTFTVPIDEPAKTVYEAWAVLDSGGTVDKVAWKTFCGIKFGGKWKSYNDGFLTIEPLTSYAQEELAELHENAIQEYGAKSSKKGRSYAQDLANRVFRLNAGVYNRIQFVINSKLRSTNKTPFRRRDWQVVVLEEGEFQMTELLPERKKKGLLRRRQEKPIVLKYFIVLRGEEVKSAKEGDGWRTFNPYSNPWWRVDGQETYEARRSHRDHVKRVGQALGGSRGPIVRNVGNRPRV